MPGAFGLKGTTSLENLFEMTIEADFVMPTEMIVDLVQWVS